MYLLYLPYMYQTSSHLHKNHKGLILTCTYSRQTPPLKHTPLVKGPTHEPPHRVTIFYGNSLSKSLLSPANSTGYQRKKETINLHLAFKLAFIAPLSRPSHLPSLCCCISLCWSPPPLPPLLSRSTIIKCLLPSSTSLSRPPQQPPPPPPPPQQPPSPDLTTAELPLHHHAHSLPRPPLGLTRHWLLDSPPAEEQEE